MPTHTQQAAPAPAQVGRGCFPSSPTGSSFSHLIYTASRNGHDQVANEESHVKKAPSGEKGGLPAQRLRRRRCAQNTSGLGLGTAETRTRKLERLSKKSSGELWRKCVLHNAGNAISRPPKTVNGVLRFRTVRGPVGKKSLDSGYFPMVRADLAASLPLSCPWPTCTHPDHR